ncbi:cadmium-translocating P-type ATPase [bacterium]|nr:cadmium-translocating P-type ATPase [bacterium]
MSRESRQETLDNQSQVSLQIKELDCAEEARILKEGLASQSGIGQLDFDVIRGRMDVQYDSEQWSPGRLIEAVQTLGMTASTIADDASPSEEESESTPPSRDRERILIRSGVFLLVAVTVQAWEMDSITKLFSLEEDSHSVSIVASFLYLISIGLGMRAILPKAIQSAWRVSADMNVLMCVAVAGAVLLGDFFEGAMVTFLFTLSEVLEQQSVSRARRSIHSLMSLAPDLARVRTDSGVDEVSTDEVQDGQICLVRPGERIPLDGTITEGISAVDQAPITGESVPIEKQPGDPLYAGTINGSGSLEFRVEGTSGSTLLTRIVRLIDQAYRRRAPSEQWVDQFARYYTPAMMMLSAAVMLLPPTFEGWSVESAGTWFYNGLVLLVIACPCALVISTPVSIVSALTAAARNGVLVKGGLSLETLAGVKAIVLDKTGTLTTGMPSVTSVRCVADITHQEAVALATGLQQHSTHPIATAILTHAEQHHDPNGNSVQVEEIAGRGIEGEVDGRKVWLGSVRLATERGVEESLLEEVSPDPGTNLVLLGEGSQLLAVLYLQDQLREQAAGAVKSMHQLGVQQIELISGDRTDVVRQVAQEVGLDDWHAEQLPEDKIEAVSRLHEKYGVVAMVGDGINDGPALAAADVGIAMGAIGSDTAIETADVALMSDEIEKVPWLIHHSRRTLGMIRQNIFVALAVKVIFVVLTFIGYSNLWLAILADTGVSLAVIANSLRLLRTKTS